MAVRLPQTTATLYEQPDGTFTDTSTGVDGEAATTVNVTDLVCVDDLDANGAETMSDLQAFAQDIYHLLSETLGSNLADPTGGLGLANVLSSSTEDALAALANVDPQISADPRTATSTTTPTYAADGSLVGASISVLPIGALLPIQFSWSAVSGLQQVAA